MEVDALEREIRFAATKEDAVLLDALAGTREYFSNLSVEQPPPRSAEENAEEMIDLMNALVLCDDGVHPFADLIMHDRPPADLGRIWREQGVRGVIRTYPSEFVDQKETNYTLLSWRGIRETFQQLELTPTPDQAEIESACGSRGLRLPSLKVRGQLYFDFEFVESDDATKAAKEREYAQARDEVASCLIGAAE